MKSKTKYEITDDLIKRLFKKAGLGAVTQSAPLGAGEYNAVFSVKAGGVEYVLKIAPAQCVPVLTYEKNMMESELFWYEQIRKHTSIRVPEIFLKDFSKEIIPADYFIMEKIQGKQLSQMDFSQAEKAEAAEQTAKMAAEIHKIKNDRFGYPQNDLYEDWYQAIRAMTQSLINDCAAVGKETKRGNRLLQMIEKNRDVLKKAECSMVNFDLNSANIICRRENGIIVYYWIDPERSFWGDRIFDFVCLEMMKPLADKTGSLNAYNNVSDDPIVITEEENIRFAVAVGFLGLIMETEKYYRYTPFHFGWWRNIAACKTFYHDAFRILK